MTIPIVVEKDGKYFHAGCVDANPGDTLKVVNQAMLTDDDFCQLDTCNGPLLAEPADDDDTLDDDDDDDDKVTK